MCPRSPDIVQELSDNDEAGQQRIQGVEVTRIVCSASKCEISVKLASQLHLEAHMVRERSLEPSFGAVGLLQVSNPKDLQTSSPAEKHLTALKLSWQADDEEAEEVRSAAPESADVSEYIAGGDTFAGLACTGMPLRTYHVRLNT